MSDYSAPLPREHHLTIRRTARYFTLGAGGARTLEVWFVCHGFGQLAGSFIAGFAALADARRLVVAPEGLSRFYLGETTGAGSANARVGATWMTREDRLVEIEDYVRYLDTLYASVFRKIRRRRAVRVTVLGFSQGVATVSRWIARGKARADRLILWGGALPPELKRAGDVERLRDLELVLVRGDRDRFVEPAVLADLEARLVRLRLRYRLATFAGGHELDATLLTSLADDR